MVKRLDQIYQADVAGLLDLQTVHKDHFNKIRAASATYIRSNEDLSAALPITFTLSNQPDVPRNLSWSFDSHAQITAFTITILGFDAKGSALSVTITQASGWSGVTAQAFSRITSIIMSARTGTGAGDTMDIGIGSLVGLSSPLVTSALIKVSKTLVAVNAYAADLPPASYTIGITYSTVDLSTGGAIADGDSYTITFKSLLVQT